MRCVPRSRDRRPQRRAHACGMGQDEGAGRGQVQSDAHGPPERLTLLVYAFIPGPPPGTER